MCMVATHRHQPHTHTLSVATQNGATCRSYYFEVVADGIVLISNLDPLYYFDRKICFFSFIVYSACVWCVWCVRLRGRSNSVQWSRSGYSRETLGQLYLFDMALPIWMMETWEGNQLGRAVDRFILRCNKKSAVIIAPMSANWKTNAKIPFNLNINACSVLA